MSKTQYVSPLALAGTANGDIQDRRGLQLAKKRMLAELELSGETTLQLNGQAFSKNDIVIFFDELSGQGTLDFHIAVAKDKVLQTFLEKAELLPLDKFLPEPLYSDPAFIDWISPYFCFSFCKLARGCIAENDTATWNTLFGNPFLMNNIYREEAWDDLEKLVEGKLEMVQYYHNEKQPHQHLPELSELFRYSFISMVADMPEERFGTVRNEYAFSMMNVCIDIFNKGHRNWATSFLEYAKTMAASDEMRKAVSDKIVEMNEIENGDNKSSGGWSNWGILRIVLFALYIIYRMATCSDFDSNRNSSFDNIRYIPAINLDSLTIKSDSVYKVNLSSDSTFDSLLRVMAKDSIFKRGRLRNPLP